MFHLSLFIFIRLIAAVVGLDAFTVKFRQASSRAGNDAEVYNSLAASLAFLNQMLGVVPVSRYVRRRLFVFIFGGEDGLMAPHEEASRKTWHAMLSLRIWEAA